MGPTKTVGFDSREPFVSLTPIDTTIFRRNFGTWKPRTS